MSNSPPLVLLADIGGTNTRVALGDGALVRAASVRRFANHEYKARGQDITHILQDYLGQIGAAPRAVCLAVAGPVHGASAQMTNLDWQMESAALCAATGAEHVAFLNDLQAQGHALGHVAPDKLNFVLEGPVHGKETMLVVGLGTGVNAAPVHEAGPVRLVAASECGHVNMPVRSADDLRLMHFVEALLAQRNEATHCGVEEFLSGRGLANLYAFAAGASPLSGAFGSAEVLEAMAQGAPQAERAGALYTALLAQMLADLALVHLPYGGIYLIGGMARAMAPHFARFGLEARFREKRRVDLLTNRFAIAVVEDDFAALTGCAHYLMQQSQWAAREA